MKEAERRGGEGVWNLEEGKKREGTERTKGREKERGGRSREEER